uniref:Ferredoxin-dependent glutamate synthase n=1 Tax=Bangiopsis subsimplex TaxID=139980 RepID=A0A1C9CCK5_9RHOD|nr:ferredoxin-dependent glutamate synthase [Bangiopsis subsimplex]AOM66084.1 ferredoxin-dependent glutamate synthase [Bangiopsis subsimplex]ARO90360.1 ferredoxin-dependent glutamate synthase [Bangiopsis subsimplex]
MNSLKINKLLNFPRHTQDLVGYLGYPSISQERDACGVGLVVNKFNKTSHHLIMQGLEALNCMEHRGGCSADKDSGDGAGITTNIPWKLFSKYFKKENIQITDFSKVGVGMIFLPSDYITETKKLVEWVIQDEGFQILGWRKVPVVDEVLGQQARSNKPNIEQIFVEPIQDNSLELEKKLYLLRKKIEKMVATADIKWSSNFYICSLSCRTIIYKGMVRSAVLGQFYQDLHHPDFEASFCLYHRRFSTNTMPKWPLAQPMRIIAHNGEINTLLGNLNWMKSREADLEHPCWGNRIQDLKPIINPENSDSANLDAVVELLINSGRDPQEAMMILVPEAYLNQPELNKYPEIINFYEYYAQLQEPWDGPALVAFTDGKKIGATLDRNGLRPARYCITKDDTIVVASEVGVINIEPEKVLQHGRLGPGQMIVIDLESNTVNYNWDIKKEIALRFNYGEWIKKYRKSVNNSITISQSAMNTECLWQWQTVFGYTTEDVELVIEHMASQAKEPTFCMGDDIPLAVLSSKVHLLYDYFKQRFAQVTNPAMDPLRENLVMSLQVSLGKRGNILMPKADYASTFTLDSPVLLENTLEEIRGNHSFTDVVDISFSAKRGKESLRRALEELCAQAITRVENGVDILILSDRITSLEIEKPLIPPLLAVGALHHALIAKGLRQQVSIIVETGQCWSTHHFACLIGYGASAVCPYLALETTRHWFNNPKTQTLIKKGKLPQYSIETAQLNYKKAVEAGLLKILSKMGISLLSSYHGAQIFECLGLGSEIINLAFTGTSSRIGGLNLEELASEVVNLHSTAFSQDNKKKLANYGFIQYRPGGEYHINSPEMAKALHKAVRKYSLNNYNDYITLLYNRPATALRDLVEFISDKPPLPIEQVEPTNTILERFCTGGMSLGALSKEVHETLAIAMNRIGGKSNSGEGGEDPIRFTVLQDVDMTTGKSNLFPHLKGLKNGDTANSAIKQIASGRFGVTPEYLVNSKQLEIKIAQGAKPGEGGQLPGAKIDSYIASLRASKAGVTLISPPPHHDIYSIEDLAQLIYDLHQINPSAKVSVKLVAEIGIGTIAAGVAKGNADIIQISGHEGGTGASPLSSIKHAGSPWELGLSEVHKVLIDNNLRDRVVLRVDGGLRTGRDTILAALMGAEEFGFGTVAMIATGCIMARICHTNSCPVGVATQRDDLRARFPGVPEALVNFFLFIAEEIREILANAGYQSLNEIIGKTSLLQAKKDLILIKTQELKLDTLLSDYSNQDNSSWLKHELVHQNGPVLDDDILSLPEIQNAVNHQSTIEKHLKITNSDRTVGARISGQLAKKYGNYNFNGQINLNFYGSAGQSFGAFLIKGLNLRLVGEANDYVGKGINGGEIVIVAPNEVEDTLPVLIGNTCLYGATGGYLFVRGAAGERFAVRNSKAITVVEGVGDHCCEYMTGGIVIILGEFGRNIGAGMTGGLTYIYDPDNSLQSKLNKGSITIQRIQTIEGNQQLKNLIMQHASKTGSFKAQAILGNWDLHLKNFWQIVPDAEKNLPETNIEYSKISSRVYEN